MELVKLTEENLAKEHICCAISNEKDVQVASKKAWLRERIREGLVFLKGNVRGKCFIEYIPAESAWAPVEAEGYMYIDCLWVSGQFKGQGYSNLLLDACEKDSRAKGKKGLVMLSSEKKRSFLADPGYLRHKGFLVADEAEPYFQLMYLPFSSDAAAPRFRACAKAAGGKTGAYTIYYTHQCPFTAKYVPLLAEVARSAGVELETVQIDCAARAQSAPCPYTAFSLYYDGQFVTHEIPSEKKFEGIIEKMRG